MEYISRTRLHICKCLIFFGFLGWVPLQTSQKVKALSVRGALNITSIDNVISWIFLKIVTLQNHIANITLHSNNRTYDLISSPLEWFALHLLHLYIYSYRGENRFTNGSRHSIVRRAYTKKYYVRRRYTHISQQRTFIPRNNITNQILYAQNPHPHSQGHPKLFSNAKPVKRIGNHNKYQFASDTRRGISSTLDNCRRYLY